MKKILWFFGESATGKKTLINNILQNTNYIKTKIGIEDAKIIVLDRTIMPYEQEKLISENREVTIIKKTKQFIESDYDILLIKGQTADIGVKRNCIEKDKLFMKIVNIYPELEMDLVLLEIPNTDLLYERMTKKDWWLTNPEKYQQLFPREIWDLKTKEFRDKIFMLKDYFSSVKIIDTTNGYKILGSDFEYGKSSNFRR